MAIISQILGVWAEKRRVELIGKYHSMGLKASGNFEKRTEIRNPNDYIVQIWAPDYTYFLVNGRQPNKNQDPQSLKKWVGWAGSTFLKDWVESKGINVSPFAVAYKIARKGIPVPNAHNAGDLVSSVFTQYKIDELKDEIGQNYIIDLKSEIIKIWQQV